MCHVLIIEDEAFVALDIQAMLETAGVDSFDFAETEQDAIAAARIRRPDVITSDVVLREGTGPAAVRTIIDELGAVPVIFITATPQACADCRPPAQIIAKPFVDRTVLAAYRDIVEARAVAATHRAEAVAAI